MHNRDAGEVASSRRVSVVEFGWHDKALGADCVFAVGAVCFAL